MRNALIILLVASSVLYFSCLNNSSSIQDEKPPLTLAGNTTPVQCIAISPDSKLIATGSIWENVVIKIWAANSGKEIRTIETDDRDISSLTFSPDGKVLVSTSKIYQRSPEGVVVHIYSALRFYSVEAGEILNTQKGIYNDAKGKSVYSSNGMFFAFFETDEDLFSFSSLIRVWSTSSAIPIQTILDDTCGIENIAISNDGKTVIGTGKTTMPPEDPNMSNKFTQSLIRIWSVETGEPVDTFIDSDRHTWFSKFAASPDGKLIAIGSHNKRIEIHSAITGQLIRIVQPGESYKTNIYMANIYIEGGVQDAITALEFSPDSRILLACVGKKLNFWDVNDYRLITTVDEPSGVTAVAWSPDGQFLVYGSQEFDKKSGFMPVSYPIKILQTNVWKKQLYKTPDTTSESGIQISGDDGGWNSKHDDALYSIKAGDSADPPLVLVFSPDGKTLAVNSNPGLWSVETGNMIQSLDSELGGYTTFAFGEDSRSLVGSSLSDQNIQKWNLPKSKAVEIYHEKYPFATGNPSHNVGIRALDVDSEGKYLASGSEDGVVKLWNYSTGEPLLVFEKDLEGRTHDRSIMCVKFSPDGKQLVTLGIDNLSKQESGIKIWGVPSGDLIRTFDRSEKSINHMVFSADGTRIFGWRYGKEIQIWSVNDGKYLKSVNAPSEKAEVNAIYPKDEIVATGNSDCSIDVWSMSTGKRIRSFSGNLDKIVALEFSPDGELLASSSHDGMVKMFSLTQKGKPTSENNSIKTIKSESKPNENTNFNGWDYRMVEDDSFMTIADRIVYLGEIAFSPDGKYLAAQGYQNSITLLDVKTGDAINTFKPENQIFHIKYNSDGNLVFFDNRGNYEIWDVNTDSPAKLSACISKEPESSATSSDGKLSVIISKSSLMVKKSGTDEIVFSKEKEGKYVNRIIFSQDGSILAYYYRNIGVTLLDTKNGEVIRRLNELDIIDFTISPDSRFIACSNNKNEINIWLVKTGEKIKTFTGHTKPARYVVFSPDSKILASSGNDATIKFWKVE